MKFKFKHVLFGVAAFAAAFFGSLTMFRKNATADDTYRTSSFMSITTDYGLGAGSQYAYDAQFSSIHPLDTKITIQVYGTNPSQSEEIELETTACRSSARGLWAEVTASTDQRVSGTQFRAHFVSYDSSGSQTYSYDRTYTIP